MAKKGIGPTIVALASSAIAGFISKKNRDAATPKKAGFVRDLGTATMMGGAANAVAPDLLNLPLDPDQQIIVNAVTVVVGAILHFWAIGKKEEKNET